jgi:hypothetical protein
MYPNEGIPGNLESNPHDEQDIAKIEKARFHRGFIFIRVSSEGRSYRETTTPRQGRP